MCELGVIIVASPADQIICSEGATEARAVVQQRSPRNQVLAWVPGAVTGHRRGVHEALPLLISKELIEGHIGEVNAKSRSALPRQLLVRGLRWRERSKPCEIALRIRSLAPLRPRALLAVKGLDGNGERRRVQLHDDRGLSNV